jgi:predicted DCC family thiol-disulfide oxidoreductase YuxK/nicotinamide riboside kinase
MKISNMPIIAITGPESTGKSALAQQLKNKFGCSWVPEYAREYIGSLTRPYQKEDLLAIAKGQVEAENEAAKSNPSLLFLDTSLEVIKIWSEFRYGDCDPWISQKLMERKHDFYLLCRPDLPWEYDPQRENPNDRQELFALYKRLLIEMQVPFAEVHGQGEERLNVALSAVLKHYPACNFLLPEWSGTPVLFFDGVCNFCNSTVQWVLKRDKKRVFRFAPLQSEVARILLADCTVNFDLPESVILLHNKKLYQRTEAVIELLYHLEGIFALLGMALKIVPAFIRNPLYGWIAQNRYRWFGKKDQCMVPDLEQRGRFF